MKPMLLVALSLHLSFAALAADLPRVQAPPELTTGEFAEGTLTRLSSDEVAEFLPWAQNARNQLQRAIRQAQSMPLRDRLPHIERAVKTVVARSGDRQYQAQMRFALNRGLLLVDELEKNMNMNDVGSQENALDLLQRSIAVGLSFYESDLTFQQRAQSGQTTTVIPYAAFGSAFMQSMYPGVVNVLDATAQYRLLYKLIEMVNWDLSRDANAPRYAEAIVEAFEMGQDLPEVPDRDDKANLRLIRRLNSLKIISLQVGLSSIQNNNEADTTSTVSSAPARSGGGVAVTPGNGGNGALVVASLQAGVAIKNIQVIKNPGSSNNLLFSAASSSAGICRALGFANFIPGSQKTSGDAVGMTARVSADGRLAGMDMVDIRTGSYVTEVTCGNYDGNKATWKVALLTAPKANGLWISTQSNTDGVCKLMGYGPALSAPITDGATYGNALVINAQGLATAVEVIDSRTGSSISRLYCRDGE